MNLPVEASVAMVSLLVTVEIGGSTVTSLVLVLICDTLYACRRRRRRRREVQEEDSTQMVGSMKSMGEEGVVRESAE